MTFTLEIIESIELFRMVKILIKKASINFCSTPARDIKRSSANAIFKRRRHELSSRLREPYHGGKIDNPPIEAQHSRVALFCSVQARLVLFRCAGRHWSLPTTTPPTPESPKSFGGGIRPMIPPRLAHCALSWGKRPLSACMAMR